MSKIKIIAALTYFAFFSVWLAQNKVYAQNQEIEKREKELAENKKAKQKEAQKAIEKQKARHLKMQSKKTQARMKATEKKARAFAEGKKEFYFSRFFKKRRK